MSRNVWKARYETSEFLAADSCLITGGFLVGNSLVNSSVGSYVGGLLVAVGLFLGLRVLWKFSSDLKNIKEQIDMAVENSKQTNEELRTNTELLDNTIKSAENTQIKLNLTSQKVQNTKRELEQTLRKSKDVEEKLFGSSGSIFAKSSVFNPLDKTVDELKQRVKIIEEKLSMRGSRWGL